MQFSCKCLFRANVFSNCLPQKRHLSAFDAFDDDPDVEVDFLAKLWKLFVCTLSWNSELNDFLHWRHLNSAAPTSDPTMVRRTSAGRTNSLTLVADDVDVIVLAIEFVGTIDFGNDDLVTVVSPLAAVASDFAEFK